MKMLVTLSTLYLLTLSSMVTASGGHGHGEDDHDAHKQETTGPNGGHLLKERDITLEVLKTESGGLASLQAWVTRDNKPVDDLILSATLTRLDGVQKRVTFQQDDHHWKGKQKIQPPHSFDVSFDLKLDGEHHQWQWPSYEGRVAISAEAAEKAGITTKKASGGVIATQTHAYGRLVIAPEHQADLRARFPGLIKSITASVGDAVSKGEILAVIESNDSLRGYRLRAPFSGVIHQRHANAGEVAGQQPLLTLINSESLWAELTLFPQQRAAVKKGQAVTLHLDERQWQSQIKSLVPAPDTGSVPAMIARVSLDNSDGRLAPGDFVEAVITTGNHSVPLRVDNRALQEMEGKTVVFLNGAEAYESRALTLGRRDNRYSEVLDGLNPGDQYVVENSYLIKADILKAGAAHHH